MDADSVFAVACSPVDSELVATGGGDDKAYIWRIRDSGSPVELKSKILLLCQAWLKLCRKLCSVQFICHLF